MSSPLETNGLHFQDLPFDWWTVSPKDVAAYRVHPRLWARASEIKLLVTPALDLALVKKMRAAQPRRRSSCSPSATTAGATAAPSTFSGSAPPPASPMSAWGCSCTRFSASPEICQALSKGTKKILFFLLHFA